MGDSRPFSRRTLLEGVAAAGAASLIRPAAGLASALTPGRAVSSRWVGSLAAESASILAPRRFALAGVQWASPATARIELRGRAPDGSWSPWAIASVLGHDGDREGNADGHFGEPIWTGAADCVEVRSDRALGGLRLYFVSAVASRVGARAASGLPPARPVLDAGPGQPAIIARRAWAQRQARPTNFAGYGTVKLGFVHHTVNPNGYRAAEVPAMLLAIFDYHVYVRGFFDIAYNFLIDAFGRIWEGRAGGIDMAVVGAQAGGYNAESTGAAVLGDFMDVVPSQAAVSALQRLLAWKLSLHGVPTHGRVTVVVAPSGAVYTPFAPGAHVSLPRVAGHRQGDSTDCPGDAFFGELPSIRPRITALAGTPARLTVSQPAGVASAGVPVSLSGRLRLLGGAGIAGAPIEVQQLGGSPGVATSRTAIASATTAADGSWSVPVARQVNAALRAVHEPRPAAVADWVYLSVAPAIALALASVSPLQVTGTISPPKPHVTIELHRAGRVHGRPLKRKVVRVVRGSFAATLPVPRPGSYVLVATHVADAANVAGSSAPVPVTIPAS